MLTIRPLFLGLNFCSTKKINQETRKPRTEMNLSIIPGFVASRLVKPMLIELFVADLAALVNFAETVRNISFSWFVGLERCRPCYGVVPMFCPNSIGFT